MTAESPVRRDGDSLLLAVKARPGARRNALVGVEGPNIKIAITAVAERGRATEHLLRFLAREFGVARAQVQLVAGEFSPIKRIRINAPKQIPPMLAPLLDRQGDISL